MNSNVINFTVVSNEHLQKRNAIQDAVKERCKSLGLSSTATETCVNYAASMYRDYKISPASAVFAGNNFAYRLAGKTHGFLPPAA